MGGAEDSVDPIAVLQGDKDTGAGARGRLPPAGEPVSSEGNIGFSG